MSITIPSLPVSGASSSGLAADFQADLATGTGNYAIELDLPRGQRGFRPDMMLNYSSGSGQGPFGQGWTLGGVMAVRLDTKHGVPDPSKPLERTFRLDGSDVLVQIGTSKGRELFRPRTDTAGWSITRGHDGWCIQTQDDVLYRCGDTTNSRIADPNTGEVVEWWLRSIETPTGQTAEFSYEEHGPARFLSRVQYGPYTVEFDYEQRRYPTVHARYGFPIELDRRCRTIRIVSQRHSGKAIKSYRIGYTLARHSEVSLLSSVTVTGGKADSTEEFPSLNFGYSDWAEDGVDLQPIRSEAELPPPPTSATAALVDIEGRGLPGILEGAATGWRFWRNLGQGQFARPEDLAHRPLGVSLGSGEATLIDLEGNGTADIFVQSAGQNGFFPNSADGSFGAFVEYTEPLPFTPGDASVRFADLDGDGVVDALKSENDAFLIYSNRGAEGWDPIPLRVPRVFNLKLFPNVDLRDPSVIIQDMSGDGLPDIVQVSEVQIAYWPYLGHGRWAQRVIMQNHPVFPSGFDQAKLRLVDIDGDGLSDLVYLDHSKLLIWRNQQGASWSDRIEIDLSAFFVDGIDVTDILGQGRPALVLSGPDPDGGLETVMHSLTFGGAKIPNLLTEISSDLGHLTEIDYGVSTEDLIQSEAGGQSWNTFLPVPVPICRSVRNTDRVAGNVQTRRYAYSDGHYCGIEREFCGFAKVAEVEENSESLVEKRLVTQFHLGTDPTWPHSARMRQTSEDRLRSRALRGSPLQVETFECQSGFPDKLLQRTTAAFETRVESRIDDRLVVRPFVTQSIEDSLDPDGSGARQVFDYAPPNKAGNPTRIRKTSGPLAADGTWHEETVQDVEMRYAALATDGTLRGERLAARITKDRAGVTLACERWLYDGEAFEGLAQGQVDRGLMSRHDELVFADGHDDPGPTPEAHGYFRIEAEAGLPPGWYRCKEQLAHGENGTITAVKDAHGMETNLRYDVWGIHPEKVTDAAGGATRISYDSAVEQPSHIAYASGVSERRGYDTLGRVTATYRSDATGQDQLMTVVAYQSAEFTTGGDLVAPASIDTYLCRRPGLTPADIDLQAGQTTTNAFLVRRFFGASGIELSAVASAAPDVTGRARTKRSADRFFHGSGQVISETRPSYDTSYLWRAPDSLADRAYSLQTDALGRSTRLSTADSVRHLEHRAMQLAVRDPNSVSLGLSDSLVQGFDSLGRLTHVTEAISETDRVEQRFRYSDQGNLIGIDEADGSEISTFRYDRLSNRILAKHRDAGARKFTYDARGDLVLAELPTGQKTAYSYDAIGRLIEAHGTEADGSDGDRKRFYYDRDLETGAAAQARLTAIEENGTTTFFRYDGAGRLVEKTRQISSGDRLTFRYGYDYLGNITELTYPDGTTIRYSYGPSGEITGIDGILDRVDYTARGLPETLQYANGVRTKMRFSSDERLTHLSINSAGRPIFQQSLDYDHNGNITRNREQNGSDPAILNILNYDRANRLVCLRRTISETSAAALLHDWAYAYDPQGNVLENSENGVGPVSYDSTRKGILVSVGSGYTRRADAAGRTIATEHLTKLRYNSFDRLVLAQRADGLQVSFKFDYLGARTLKRVTIDGVTQDTHYMDDLFERGPEGDRLIVRGPTGVLAVIEISGGKTVTRLLHADHLGSVRAFSDANGTSNGVGRYTSFGLPTGDSDFDYFTGKFSDTELGLIQLGQRFYEPLTGRFLTPDPVLIERPEVAGGLPGLQNVFAYASNNPIRFVDPRGRLPILAGIIIGAVIGAVIGAQVAKEQGGDPLVGGLIGALVGGLVGWAGLLKPALIGAGLGALGAPKDRVWTGAAVGFVFGAIGGSTSSWLPVLPGDSGLSMVGNFFIEVAGNALVAGLSAGTYAYYVNDEDFGSAFESGLAAGAVLSTARIALFGVRYDPTSVREGVVDGSKAAFKAQTAHDTHGPWSAATKKAGMPDIGSVDIRRGGLLTASGRSHAIAPGGVSLSKSTVAEISRGDYSTFAHELRHITQQRAASWGYIEFVSRWILSSSDLHYTKGPTNTTPEPYY